MEKLSFNTGIIDAALSLLIVSMNVILAAVAISAIVEALI